MRFLPDEAKKYTAVKGDVLVCEGGYPGRCAIWQNDGPIYFQKALHRIRFHEPAHNKWFVYFVYWQDKSGLLRSHFSGTGIQHFTGEALDRFPMPLPPTEEVRRHAAIFDELAAMANSLGDTYTRKKLELDALKAAVLDRAFSGAL